MKKQKIKEIKNSNIKPNTLNIIKIVLITT